MEAFSSCYKTDCISQHSNEGGAFVCLAHTCAAYLTLSNPTDVAKPQRDRKMKILIGALVLLSVQHVKCQFEIDLPGTIDESVSEILRDLPPASSEQLECFFQKASPALRFTVLLWTCKIS